MDSQLFGRLVGIRRQLHQHPELGFTEFKTAALVESFLQELDIPVERVAVTGVVGTLKKGEGPTVMIRADMDALPVLEDTGLPFSSLTEGLMHACGHDLHTTMLLGAAFLLKEARFEGTVKFVFQPAEESNLRSPVKGKSGGQLIAESGLLDTARAAIGLHVHPMIPTGKLAYRNGEALANVGNFSIRINGKGGHPGAMEHVIDPILVAGHLITRARNFKTDPASTVLAFAHVESLAKPSFNVIPSGVLLQGSLRAIQLAVYQDLAAQLQWLTKELEAEFNCQIELDYSAYYPSLLNDAGVQEHLSGVQKKIFGESNIVESPIHLIGEDFAFYSRMMPAQFYYLGAGPRDGGDPFFLHHPQVIFNEDCIQYGSTFLAEGAIALLDPLALANTRSARLSNAQ